MAFKKKEAVVETEETKEVMKETKSVKTYTVFELAHMSNEDRLKAITEAKQGKAVVID